MKKIPALQVEDVTNYAAHMGVAKEMAQLIFHYSLSQNPQEQVPLKYWPSVIDGVANFVALNYTFTDAQGNPAPVNMDGFIREFAEKFSPTAISYQLLYPHIKPSGSVSEPSIIELHNGIVRSV